MQAFTVDLGMSIQWFTRLAGLLLLAGFGGLSARAQNAGQASNFPLTEKRLGMVRLIVDGLVKEDGFEGKSNEEFYDVVVERLNQARIDCRLRPREEVVTLDKCRELAQKRAEAEVAAELPRPAAELLAKLAAEKFPLLQEGEKVKLTFMPNPARQVVVEGTFQGYDGKNIIVNRAHYQLESVRLQQPQTDNPLLLLDRIANQEARDSFARDEEREYLRRRSDLLDRKNQRYMRDELTHAIQTNEANGYILFKRQWVSLKEVIETEIAAARAAWEAEKQRQREAEAAKLAEEAAAKAREEAAAAGEVPAEPPMLDQHGNLLAPLPWGTEGLPPGMPPDAFAPPPAGGFVPVPPAAEQLFVPQPPAN